MLHSASAPRTNLPAALTSFVGRTRERADVGRLLASSRLVTLTGGAGCGKTRLALHVAAEVRRRCADGVHWVDLARLTDPALVPQAAARALHVIEQPGRTIMEALLQAIHDKHLLLVLDNCEHVLRACTDLAQAVLGGSEISILATSREPLHIAGEMRYPLSPLALPPHPPRNRRSGAVRCRPALRRAGTGHPARLCAEPGQCCRGRPHLSSAGRSPIGNRAGMRTG